MQSEKQGFIANAANAIVLQHNNNVLVNYRGVYHIDWKSHLYWTLAIIFFILARLWWLVPLPGETLLPAYRTYPAGFFNTLFLGFACALATRSITVALVKPFEEGIHPDSVVAFGATGGFGAMWSCIRYRSGLRYFLLAFLVTAATLLGNALEAELQSSMSTYYKLGATTDVSLAECQHSTSNDYQTASSAYSSGLITHTLTDASVLLKNYAYQPTIKPYSVSLLKTTLTPAKNISLGGTTVSTTTESAVVAAPKLRRRHYHRTTKACEDQEEEDDSTSATLISSTTLHHPAVATTASPINSNTITTTTTATATAATTSTVVATAATGIAAAANGTITSISGSPTIISVSPDNEAQQQQKNNLSPDTIVLNIDGDQIVLNTTSAVLYNFNSSALMIAKDINNAAVPVVNSSDSRNIKLNVFRHITSDKKQVIIVYSAPSDGYIAGAYVSATASNYTCQSQLCSHSGDHEADNQVVADALVQAIQSGEGLYGSQGLAATLLNHGNLEDAGRLADALYANPNCPQITEIPTKGNMLYPYSAARFNVLSLIWILGYVLIWLLGAYLIGYSEETWSQLARTGRMLPQIISNSSNLFADGISGKTVNQEAYLSPADGKMTFAKEHNHGYTVTTEEVLAD